MSIFFSGGARRARAEWSHGNKMREIYNSSGEKMSNDHINNVPCLDNPYRVKDTKFIPDVGNDPSIPHTVKKKQSVTTIMATKMKKS